MKISKYFDRHNSSISLANKLHTYVDACAGLIHIRTQEIMRCRMVTRSAIFADTGSELVEWDIVNGFIKIPIQDKNIISTDTGEIVVNPADVIAKPLAHLQEMSGDFSDTADAPDCCFYVYINFHTWFDNPVVVHHIQTYADLLPTTNRRIIFITPDAPLPDNIADTMVSIRLDTPGQTELRKFSDDIILKTEDTPDLKDVDKTNICQAASGMTQSQFGFYFALGIVENQAKNGQSDYLDSIVSTINLGKTDVVNKNDLLELYPIERIENVGGMHNIKSWVDKRKGCFTDEAKQFGVEPPKGVVLVGPPGTGKSLVAKAVAGVLNVPLVRFDFGRVFNALVGSSEERIRTALRMVDSMAPCVLFCDEIDKGLGGIGGSGDSGTSSRVLGTFLTWLQDNTNPVFTMVTANNITGLPPELLRRGRFDAIFSSSLPDDAERTEILRIQLRRRKYDLGDYSSADIEKVIRASNGYVGAEIESAVKDGIIEAFSAKRKLSMNHIASELKAMAPLSKAYSKQIQEMTAWSKAFAIPASGPGAKSSAPQQKSEQQRTRRLRTKAQPRAEVQ